MASLAQGKRQFRPTYQLLFCDEIMSLSSPRELTQMAKQEKQRLWEERIEAFLASGQSQRAWCQEQGLRANQLGYWLRKYKARMSQSAGKRWISMESTSPCHSGVSLRVGNIVLDIEPGFSRQVLVDVLHSLMNVC
jgi:transposase-like protein